MKTGKIIEIGGWMRDLSLMPGVEFSKALEINREARRSDEFKNKITDAVQLYNKRSEGKSPEEIKGELMKVVYEMQGEEVEGFAFNKVSLSLLKESELDKVVPDKKYSFRFVLMNLFEADMTEGTINS